MGRGLIAAARSIAVTLLGGVAVSVMGTMAHRAGVGMNLPYGLVLAYAMVALATWNSRARLGAAGVALQLIASTSMAWLLAAPHHGSVLLVMGFHGDVSWLSQHVGSLWFYGLIVVQLLVGFAVPRKLIMASLKPDDKPAGDKQSDDKQSSKSQVLASTAEDADAQE